MNSGLRKTLVGIYIIGGFILSILFYIYLSGKLGFRATYDIKVYLPDVTWLKPGDPVMIYGIEKGKVKSFRIEGDKVLVTLAIDRDIKIPEDSRISTKLVNYLSSDRYIKIIPGKSDKVAEVYYGYDETQLFEAFAAKLDSLAGFLEDITLPDFAKLGDSLLNSLSRRLKEVTTMFEEPSARVNLLISKIDNLVDTLSSLTEEEGTVKKLIKSDELYKEVMKTNESLRALIEDIKANPERYLKIKVF